MNNMQQNVNISRKFAEKSSIRFTFWPNMLNFKRKFAKRVE